MLYWIARLVIWPFFRIVETDDEIGIHARYSWMNRNGFLNRIAERLEQK